MKKAKKVGLKITLKDRLKMLGKKLNPFYPKKKQKKEKK